MRSDEVIIRGADVRVEKLKSPLLQDTKTYERTSFEVEIREQNCAFRYEFGARACL